MHGRMIRKCPLGTEVTTWNKETCAGSHGRREAETLIVILALPVISYVMSLSI